MKTNPNETTIKPAEAMTDDDILKVLIKLSGGHRGHWATYEIPTDNAPCYLKVYHSQGWTDANGQAHAQPPAFLHSVDALLPLIRLLSFEGQMALNRRVRLQTPPRTICLEILRELGHFDP